jgi:kynurenine formamidase
MSLDLFYGTAVCLDVTEFKAQTDISAEDLDRVESESPVDVRPDDIVLFHTATWNRYSGDKKYLSEFAGLGESASEWIVQRRIKTFGVDSPTPDNPVSTSYPCHMMCRREHITHYENLANLDRVVNTRFTFVGFPLKLRGAHGGPTRAVALIEG